MVDVAGARSFAVEPAELAAAGNRIQTAVGALPAALDRFIRDGYASPAEFGSTAQDQQVGDTYVALCHVVAEMLPMTQDGIYSLGGAVRRWAEVFADQDAEQGRAIRAGLTPGR